MKSVYISAVANETFINYSRRINFRRLRIAMLCSLCLFLTHGFMLLFLNLAGLYRKPIGVSLMVNDFVFGFVDSLLFAIIVRTYRRMTSDDNYHSDSKQRILSYISLIVFYLGPVALYSISETRMTFITPFALICLSNSILFFMNAAAVVAFNLFSFILNFVLVINIYGWEGLTPFRLVVPFGVFMLTMIASLILQNERKTTFTMVQESLAFGKRNLKDFGSKHGLTEREIEVVLLLSEGRKYKNIAEVLSVSKNTARTHVRHIYEKTGVSARLQLLHLINSNRNQKSPQGASPESVI